MDYIKYFDNYDSEETSKVLDLLELSDTNFESAQPLFEMMFYSGGRGREK